MDEALVEDRGVLGGDALGVLALGQAGGLPKDDVDEVAEQALVDAEHLVELFYRLALVVGLEDGSRAKLLDVLGVPETGIFRRKVEKGVFINAGGNLYYMDPNAAEDFVAARRKRVFFMLVLALIALLVLWAVNGRLFR